MSAARARSCAWTPSRRAVGDRRAGRDPPRGLERRPTRRGHPDRPRLNGARFALWKNPEHLTARQQTKLSTIQTTNRRLYRAYLLKEQLRQICRLPADAAIAPLDG